MIKWTFDHARTAVEQARNRERDDAYSALCFTTGRASCCADIRSLMDDKMNLNKIFRERGIRDEEDHQHARSCSACPSRAHSMLGHGNGEEGPYN